MHYICIKRLCSVNCFHNVGGGPYSLSSSIETAGPMSLLVGKLISKNIYINPVNQCLSAYSDFLALGVLLKYGFKVTTLYQVKILNYSKTITDVS